MPHLPLALFALACGAASALGHSAMLRAGAVDLPAFWLASGVLAGALLSAGQNRSRWTTLAVVAAGVMLGISVLVGRPLYQSAVLGVVSAIEGTAVAAVMHRICGRVSLTTLSHIWTLVCVAALVPLAGAALAATALGLGGGDWVLAWRALWLMEAPGILLMVPLVLSATRERADLMASLRGGKAVETAVVTAGAVVSAMVVFGGTISPVYRVPAYMLPFFLWSVFRLGVAGTATTVLLIGVIGLSHTAGGRGPFALPDTPLPESLLRSQGTLAIAAASFLLMAGAVAERRRVARENELLVKDLQKALAEIKTLRGFIPLCAWCHKIRDDAGFWQQIDNYLDTHTEAEVSHSICPTCNERAQLEIAAHNTERA